jgi:hypothetical protein
VHPIRRRSRKHCSGARILPDEVRFEVGSGSTAPLANISYMPDITGILRFVIVNASKAIDSINISNAQLSHRRVRSSFWSRLRVREHPRLPPCWPLCCAIFLVQLLLLTLLRRLTLLRDSLFDDGIV